MGYHAKLSPSSAHCWTSCTASIQAQEGLTDDGSEAAREGTCCHQIQAEVLVSDTLDPSDYLGRVMEFWRCPSTGETGETWESECDYPSGVIVKIEHTVTVTDDMVAAVHSAVDFIREVHALKGGTMEVEQRVPIGHFTGEEDATGSCDVGLIGNTWVHVLDSKYGRVQVDAFDVIEQAGTDIITGEPTPEITRANLQMACYALGFVEKFALFGDFTDDTQITLTIVQPFIHHISDYSCTLGELLKVRDFLAAKARETRTNPVYVPTSDNCFYCKAAGPTCAAQTQMVLEMTLDGFEDVETAAPKPINEAALGTHYANLGLIYGWCEAVATKVYESLRQGLPVTRSDGLFYKLVDGRKGNRKWSDEAEVTEALHDAELTVDQIYAPRELISPAKAEELTKSKRPKKGQPRIPPVISAEQWEALQALMTQSDGKASIALSTDPRPAVSTTDGFEDVPLSEDGDINGDLF